MSNIENTSNVMIIHTSLYCQQREEREERKEIALKNSTASDIFAWVDHFFLKTQILRGPFLQPPKKSHNTDYYRIPEYLT